jgi:hypothetical protein
MLDSPSLLPSVGSFQQPDPDLQSRWPGSIGGGLRLIGTVGETSHRLIKKLILQFSALKPSAEGYLSVIDIVSTGRIQPGGVFLLYLQGLPPQVTSCSTPGSWGHDEMRF